MTDTKLTLRITWLLALLAASAAGCAVEADADALPPEQLGASEQAVSLGNFSAGGDTTVVVKADRTVWSAGSDAYGQFGDGTAGGYSSVPVRSLLNDIGRVAAGARRTVALGATPGSTGFTLWTWGDGLAKPVKQAGTWLMAAALNQAPVALRADGSLWSFNVSNNTAIPVLDGANQIASGFTAISGGTGHLAALRVSQVWTVGSNSSGELGIGTTSTTPAIVPVVGLSGVVVDQVAAGDAHTMARTRAGAVYTWGKDLATNRNVTTPTQVAGLANVIDIAAGGAIKLALTSDGAVWQWGSGTCTLSAVPVKVTGLPPIVAITQGRDHSVARASDGTLWTWGRNDKGQLARTASQAWDCKPAASQIRP